MQHKWQTQRESDLKKLSRQKRMQERLRRRHLVIVILSFQWILVLVTVQGRPFGRHGKEQKCDLYEGSWVIDSSYPLYHASNNCSNIVGQGFDCLKNGRPDQHFLSYRWKPFSCDLPRFHLLFLNDIIHLHIVIVSGFNVFY